MLKEGMFIQERYEIVSRIGSGGMADVYKAKDHKLNRFVAVKVLKKEFREDKAFISKFRVEAQSAAGLAHPNIVNVYDVGEDQGVYFIVMELVEGITLKEYIEKKGRLAVREATSIAIQVSMGLEAAHHNNIVHRDVKPQNIIISTDGKVKVTDFGIARAASSNTISSNVMGSVHYSSPEQARGGYSDYKSDIYSLGITMYEMVTGHVPFDGESTVAIAIKHLQEEMQSPRKYVPDLPKSTVQIIYKCTQKSPDRRYGDMEELIRDLKESLVNPEGDFVQIAPLNNHAQTVVISKDEMDQIKQGYGEAAQSDQQHSGAYGQGGTYGTYGSYGGDPYQNGRYPEDEYDEDEEDDGVNRKAEKFMTVGSIVVGVIILFIFLALVGNAVGLFDFGFLTDGIKHTESVSESGTNGDDTEDESAAEDEVTVPDLKGMTREEAQDALNELGLGGTYGGERESAEYPEGQIIDQTPSAGSKVEKNTTITYIVSKGSSQELVTVPDVTGMTLTEALAELSAEGFTYTSEYVESSSVESGLVIYSEPAAGASAEAGSAVKLYISEGEEGDQSEESDETGDTEDTEDSGSDTVSMPYVVGQSAADARSALESLGLYVEITEDVSSTYGAGTVMSQSVSSGNSVEKGTTVSLVVSAGAADPEVQGGSTSGSESGSGSNTTSDANNASHSYACNVELTAPAGYDGQNVKLVVEQDGVLTTVLDGAPISFPYVLSIPGTSDSLGTAYMYVTNDDGSTSTYTYPNVPFKQVD